MNNQEILDVATGAVLQLKDHIIDVLSVKRPRDLQTAVQLSKVVSKLSPIVGNILEATIVQYLNEKRSWPEGCLWIRQDPAFPDTVLSGMPRPQPGMEIKAWFPLATEITARFRDSQTFLQEENTKVVVLCWLLEFIIAGRPRVVDVFVCDAIDVAKARDAHYHHPPEYIVLEPEDTSSRTANVQQKNCQGLRFQDTATKLQEARTYVESWGPNGCIYRTDTEYQALLRELTARFSYRPDTNFSKIDRIRLSSLEAFKQHVLQTSYLDQTVSAWINTIKTPESAALLKLIDLDSPSPVEL